YQLQYFPCLETYENMYHFLQFFSHTRLYQIQSSTRSARTECLMFLTKPNSVQGKTPKIKYPKNHPSLFDWTENRWHPSSILGKRQSQISCQGTIIRWNLAMSCNC